MIEHAGKSQFKLPLVLLPIVALGLYVMGDILTGFLMIPLFERFSFNAENTNRVLLLSVLVNALILLFWVRFVECRTPMGLGLTAGHALRDLSVGTAAGIGAMVCVTALGCLARVVSYDSVNAAPANLLSVLLMLPCWAVQAGTEELLTRGWILPAVSARSNKTVGLVVSSVLFVLMHLQNAGLNVTAILNIFLIGVLLGLYTLKTDNLWGAIAFHTLWNFMLGSFFGLSVSGGSATAPNLFHFVSDGTPVLSGGAFGIEGSLLTTAVLMLLLLAMVFTGRKNLRTSR